MILNKKNPLFRGSLELLFSNTFLAIASYGVIIIIGRSVGIASFGKYVVVIAVLAAIELLTAEAFTHPMVSALARGDLPSLRRLRLWQILSAGVAALCLGFFGNVFARIFHDPEMSLLFTLSALDILPFALFVRNISLLTALDKFRERSVGTFVYGLGKILFMGGAVWYGKFLPGVFLGLALASFLAYLITQVLLGTWFSSERKKDKQSPPAHYGASLMVTVAIGLVFGVDIWMLKTLQVGDSVVGAYGASQNIVKVIYLAAMSLMWPLIPTLARSSSLRLAIEESKELRKLLILLVGGTVFGGLFASLFAEYILQIFFGKEFSESIPFLRRLGPNYALLVMGLTAMQILLHTGKSALAGGLALFTALSFPLLVFLLIGNSGALSVTYASGIVGASILIGILCSQYRKENKRL